MANNGRGKSPGSREALKTGKPFNEETARKAAERSAESKRRRRTLREELLLILSDEGVQKSIAAALIAEAIEGNGSGSVRGAFETIRDTIGEKPKEAVELSGAGSVRFVFGSGEDGEDISG